MGRSFFYSFSLAALACVFACTPNHRATGSTPSAKPAAAPAAGGAQASPSDAAPARPGSTLTRGCSRSGWSTLDAMPTCGAVCQPDVLAQRVPALSFQPREGWCSGCLLLDTPWATTREQRKRAVGSGIRGSGAGPDFAQVGMYLSPTQG